MPVLAEGDGGGGVAHDLKDLGHVGMTHRHRRRFDHRRGLRRRAQSRLHVGYDVDATISLENPSHLLGLKALIGDIEIFFEFKLKIGPCTDKL